MTDTMTMDMNYDIDTGMPSVYNIAHATIQPCHRQPTTPMHNATVTTSKQGEYYGN